MLMQNKKWVGLSAELLLERKVVDYHDDDDEMISLGNMGEMSWRHDNSGRRDLPSVDNKISRMSAKPTLVKLLYLMNPRKLNYVDTGRWSDRPGGDEGKISAKRKGSHLTNTMMGCQLMMRKKKVTNKCLFNRSLRHQY